MGSEQSSQNWDVETKSDDGHDEYKETIAQLRQEIADLRDKVDEVVPPFPKVLRPVRSGIWNQPAERIDNTPKRLLHARPGDHFSFFRHQFHFIDLKDPNLTADTRDEIRRTLKSSISEACRWSIDRGYLDNAMAKARYLLMITMADLDFLTGEYSEKLGDIGAVSFALASERNSTSLNLDLVCAGEMTAIEDSEEEVRISASFGLLMMCILFKRAKSLGYKDVYLDAAEADLLPYYAKFGFKVGKESCGETDINTQDFEQAMEQHTLDDYFADLEKNGEYATDHGYAMKLCGMDYTTMCRKAARKLKAVWPQMRKFQNNLALHSRA